jgi:hypothetical protein
MPGIPDADEYLENAKKHFESARDSWNQAATAYPDDARVQGLLQDVQEYLHDINKRMTVG